MWLPYNQSVKKGQALYIKNPAAHRLAQQLSKQMGVTLTEAVIHALEDQLNAAKKPKPIDRKKGRGNLSEDVGASGTGFSKPG